MPHGGAHRGPDSACGFRTSTCPEERGERRERLVQVRIVGAHNAASRDHRLGCVILDGLIALDAGSISVGLSFESQAAIEAVFVTHRHYDHIRDLLTLGLANSLMDTTVDVYGIEPTIHALEEHFLNGILYPDPTKRPSPDMPAMSLHIVDLLQSVEIGLYQVTPVSVAHTVEACGYEVRGADGTRVFYSGDTGPGVVEAWPHIRPDLMLLECTLEDSRREQAAAQGHLTPSTFGEVATRFRETNGYLPDLVAVHLSPFSEREVRRELAQVSREIGVSIRVASEDDLYSVTTRGVHQIEP